MGMRRITASALPRLMRCAFWARPDIENIPDPPGEAAQTGTLTHEIIAARLSKGQWEPAIPEGADSAKAARLVQRWEEWREGRHWEPEVKLAFDLQTGEARILTCTGPRDYSQAKATEVIGSADAVQFVNGQIHVIGDWKTGTPDHVEPASGNAQLHMLALAATRISGRSTATVFLAFLSESGVTVDEHQLDAMDLDAFELRLRERIASIPKAKPEPGDHCRYCPARTACPAFVDAAAEVSPETGALIAIGKNGNAITPDMIAKAWPQLRLIKAGIEQIEARIKAAVEAAGGTMEIGNGRALRMTDGSRENLSAASIKRAMGKDAEPLLARLREAGAIEQSTFRMMREVKR